MSDYLVEILTIGVVLIVGILLFRLYAKESAVSDAILEALGDDESDDETPPDTTPDEQGA